MVTKRIVAALLLGSAVATLGPVACKVGDSEAAAAQGTGLGILPASMDTSVKPGDDFYNYANGAWMRDTEIPADRSNIGGFWIADQQTEKNLEALIAELGEYEPEAGTDAAREKA